MEVGRGLVVCAALVVLTAGVGAVAATDHEDPALAQDIEADNVVLIAEIDADGDAAWRVVYRQQLDDEADRQAFAELQDDIETNTSSYLDPFVDRMERTVASAENATGREMAAGSFSVTTERRSQPDTELGEVTFRFEWRGFAAVEDGGDRLRAGDAVDQLFLATDRSLELRWPGTYGLVERTPGPDTVEPTRVVWRGQREFDEGEPRVVLATDGGAPADGGAGDDDTGGESPILLSALAVGVVLVVGVALLWRRRQEAEEVDDGEDDAPAVDGDDGPPAELLSNEERVLRLLERNGGRVKQQAVAEELDWTDAKTSQVVGDLRDAGKVEAFRLGRENVLTLPDVDIDGESRDEE